jgi:hypothetical protein
VYRCDLFGSTRPPHGRFWPHNGARGRLSLAAPGCQARLAEGVMVRRLSVASRDSAAESPVYGAEPPASRSAQICQPNRSEAASGIGLGAPVNCREITSHQVPQGGATRHIRATVGLAIPGQVGTGVPRLATTCDMSVVDQQSARWYVKDIRASTHADGNPTWFASSWAVPRGPWSRRKLTDVHGREGC